MGIQLVVYGRYDIISQFEYNNHECHLTKRELEDLTLDKNASNNIMDSFVHITKRVMKMQNSNRKICNADDQQYLFPSRLNFKICPILDEENRDSVLNRYHTLNSTLDDENVQFIENAKNGFQKQGIQSFLMTMNQMNYQTR